MLNLNDTSGISWMILVKASVTKCFLLLDFIRLLAMGGDKSGMHFFDDNGEKSSYLQTIGISS